MGIDLTDGIERRGFLKLALFGAAAAAVPRIAAAQSGKIRIGVIGGGNIGGSIGGLWVKAGHEVLFASRNPEQLKPLVDRLGPLARAGTVAEALAFGEAILVAVPYRALPELGEQYGAQFAGKIVMDPTNATAARDGTALLTEAREKGIGAATSGYLKGARLVRAFNSMGASRFVSEANRPGELMAIPLAGDDAQAIAVVTGLVRAAGFDAVAVPLARAPEFAQGGPLYNQQLTAPVLRERLGLPPGG